MKDETKGKESVAAAFFVSFEINCGDRPFHADGENTEHDETAPEDSHPFDGGVGPGLDHQIGVR